ncbi:MAG TPA: MATE family efflux transporter [Noviherbaspirillum sp.]|jgi:MATE family multidrug resistance protein|uniref:MATE family efflux transporter n=1 Tax=Noviherbaspirillum sp. TaxID=1926288 RepID=UPI002DDD3A88|nr:MATE family efflux transporter [Noviherbaspirillum sp.]HEV2612885.1 MATE family efflux transporter [Noviherbaspirillum sp.]
MEEKAQRPTTRIAMLAWPILVGQLAVIANGVIDTAMTSRFSATDLAALAIGASIYVSVFVGLNGVLQALSPIVAQMFGAQRLAEVGYEVKQGAWLALFLSVVGCLVLLFPHPLLSLAQASPELTEKSVMYLRILALALPATLGFRIYGALNTALARPKMLMAIQVGALLLKIPLNALFIFGWLGLPAYGGPGCAMATAITSWLTFLISWGLVRTLPFYKSFGIFGTGFSAPNWKAQLALLKLGIPMGMSYLIEVTAFTFMALFIARLGDTAVAGHQITANFATVLYMLPLSIASATSTLVAQSIGARRLDTARHIGFVGIRLAAVLSVTIGCAVWLARDLIVRAYTPDEAIIAAALPLFAYIAIYQLFDSVQVTTAFVLRAYRVAVVPTIMYAVALWGIGLGGGYILGLDPFGISPRALQGPAGFWMGNSASLALVAAGLFWYLRKVQRDVERSG